MDDFYKWYIGKFEYDKKTIVITIDDRNIETYYNALLVLKNIILKQLCLLLEIQLKKVSIG